MKPKPNTTLVEYLTSWSRGPPGTAGAHRGRLTDRPVREGRIIIFVRKTLTAGFAPASPPPRLRPPPGSSRFFRSLPVP
eukprot:623354-Pyramimonas_sp.AAC.1